jgi:hypothetical protein
MVQLYDPPGFKTKIFLQAKALFQEVDKRVAIGLVGSTHDPSHSIENTPFSLVYDSKAMLSTEVEHKSF